jgi:hypothetical protein
MLLTMCVTYSEEQIHFWKLQSLCYSSKSLPFMEKEVYYRVHKSPLLETVLLLRQKLRHSTAISIFVYLHTYQCTKFKTGLHLNLLVCCAVFRYPKLKNGLLFVSHILFWFALLHSINFKSEITGNIYLYAALFTSKISNFSSHILRRYGEPDLEISVLWK